MALRAAVAALCMVALLSLLLPAVMVVVARCGNGVASGGGIVVLSYPTSGDGGGSALWQ